MIYNILKTAPGQKPLREQVKENVCVFPDYIKVPFRDIKRGWQALTFNALLLKCLLNDR